MGNGASGPDLLFLSIKVFDTLGNFHGRSIHRPHPPLKQFGFFFRFAALFILGKEVDHFGQFAQLGHLLDSKGSIINTHIGKADICQRIGHFTTGKPQRHFGM